MLFNHARASALLATGLTLSLVAVTGAHATPALAAPVSHPTEVHPKQGTPANDFGADAASSADVLVTGRGDSAGYHVQVATAKSGFVWRELAVIHPAGVDDGSWLGYQCVSGDGRYAAVAVLPRSGVNIAAARDHGGFAYSVDLSSGQVRPLSAGVGLKYHSPGCGLGDTAVFTANPGNDEATTTVRTVDLAKGTVTAQVTVPGQVTSVVPVADAAVGAVGNHLVRITGGRTVPVATVPGAGPAAQLRPTADGGVDFVAPAAPGAADAVAWHNRAGANSRIGSGPLGRLHLFDGRAGRPVLSGASQVDAAAGVTVASDAALPHGANAASLDGRALLGDAADPTAADPAVLATATGRLVSRPHSTATVPASTLTPAVATKASATPQVTAAAQTPTCAVPRLDPTRQALQPTSAQADWGAQMAAQGVLNGSFSRPANYASMGLAAYSPSNDFARHVLSHPSSDSLGHRAAVGDRGDHGAGEQLGPGVLA